MKLLTGLSFLLITACWILPSHGLDTIYFNLVLNVTSSDNSFYDVGIKNLTSKMHINTPEEKAELDKFLDTATKSGLFLENILYNKCDLQSTENPTPKTCQHSNNSISFQLTVSNMHENKSAVKENYTRINAGNYGASSFHRHYVMTIILSFVVIWM